MVSDRDRSGIPCLAALVQTCPRGQTLCAPIRSGGDPSLANTADRLERFSGRSVAAGFGVIPARPDDRRLVRMSVGCVPAQGAGAESVTRRSHPATASLRTLHQHLTRLRQPKGCGRDRAAATGVVDNPRRERVDSDDCSARDAVSGHRRSLALVRRGAAAKGASASSTPAVPALT